MDSLLAYFYTPSLDLIMLVVAVVTDAFLAAVVYFSAPKSATNKIFSVLTIFTMLWLVTTYIVRLPEMVGISLFLHRLGIFFAAPMSACFFLLAHTMPAERIQLRRFTFWLVMLATLGMMVLNLSPYAFIGIDISSGVSQPLPGLGLVPFAVLSTFFSILTIFFLIRKYFKSTGDEQKQIGLVLSGVLIMLACITLTILFPILIFNSILFLPFTPLYALIFLGMTAYAVTKYQLFNIKVLLTQSVALAICVVLFARLFGESSANAQMVDGLVLVVMVVFGFFLVQSVRKEVEQRERIQKLADELAATNERQEGLIRFISHEVKGFLAKDAGAFAALLDGDFGPVSEGVRPFVTQALTQTREGVASVMDILKASNQKKGTIEYKREAFDLSALLSQIVEKTKPLAIAKHLELTLAVDAAGAPYAMNGDQAEIGDHVLRNLIENAINYTPSGSIAVSLRKAIDKFIITVKDTGVGISDEDKKRLFTEGGHGKDSQKINVHSTGYGLFIAKNIVVAHGGTIRAESEGSGKGSTFIVELPA